MTHFSFQGIRYKLGDMPTGPVTPEYIPWPTHNDTEPMRSDPLGAAGVLVDRVDVEPADRAAFLGVMVKILGDLRETRDEVRANPTEYPSEDQTAQAAAAVVLGDAIKAGFNYIRNPEAGGQVDG